MELLQKQYLQAVADGNLSFEISVGIAAMAVGALALVALAFLSYRNTTHPLPKPWKAGLIGLRSGTFLLLGFCLLEPGVLMSNVVPQKTYLAVLVDDSGSMGIRDDSRRPSRHRQSVDLLYGSQDLVDRLGENFRVRTYRFSDVARRLAGPDVLNHSGSRSALGAGIGQVVREMEGFPLAGMVLISDGADNGDTDPLQPAQDLAKQQIPLHAVAIGAEAIKKDVSLVKAVATTAPLQDGVYSARLTLKQQGYEGRDASLTITLKGKVVAEERLRLGKAGGTQHHTVQLRPREKDVLIYDVQVETMPGETIAENNRHTLLVDNRRSKPRDVLYVEGQPRNEYKFIRRAVKDDGSLRLATYLQTGPRKFLRQGIESPRELSDGFPGDAETLFRYEAVILGNVDPALLDEQQRSLLQDFVARRGGGLLVLGGLHDAFIDSPLEAVLPVETVRQSQLPSHLQGGPRRGDHPTGTEYKARLTRAGEHSPILRLHSRDNRNRELWGRLPELQGIYVSGRAKPGASVLLEHPHLNYGGSPLPVLSLQRYGAGRSMVLATASSWRWQMMMPSDDPSHERLWRQMLRWLAESQQRVTVSPERNHYSVGDTVTVTARLLNGQFRADGDSAPALRVKGPDGGTQEFPMQWQTGDEGLYRQSFTVSEQGVYDLTVNLPGRTGDDLQAREPIVVTESRREFLQAGADPNLMRRLADATGGGFYTADSAGDLVDDIKFAPNAYSKMEMHSLWDQPVFLILLVLLVSLEWLARRYKGLS